MHNTPSRHTPPTPPPTSFRWKRGRPVTSRDNSALALASNRREHLWSPSQGLRFAPTAPTGVVGAHHSTPVAQRSETTQHLDDGSSTMKESEGTGVDTVCVDDPSSPPPTFSDHPEVRTAILEPNEDVSEQEGSSRNGQEDDLEKPALLAYQIPPHKLRAAMCASPNTRASYWSTKLYEGPGGESISIHYCKSFDVAERVAQHFLKEKVIGFDIEWKPRGNLASIKQNASLIQVACSDRIALFHVSLFAGTTAAQLMPPSLKTVLESPEIIKVGVAVKGDFKRLQKYLDIQAAGVYELSRLHNLVEWYEVDPSKVTRRLVGLAAQVLQHLQLPLYKGERLHDDPEITSSVRESDWSLPLGLQQIHYAATDAYAGFRLYDTLERKRAQLRPVPAPIQLCDYDSIPAPKAKAPRGKTKAATTPKGAEANTESTVESVEAEQDEVEDSEGYDTAPEELMDSHQLEESVPTIALTDGNTTDVAESRTKSRGAAEHTKGSDAIVEHEFEAPTRHKRIGRVNLSRLRGLDPEYPLLARSSREGSDEVSQDHEVHHAASFGPGIASDNVDTFTYYPDLDEVCVSMKDDEFADTELEKALQDLSLDSDGRLGVVPIQVATDQMSTEQQEASPSNPTAATVDHLDAEHGGGKPPALLRPATHTFEPPTISSGQISSIPAYDVATSWARDYLQSSVPSPSFRGPSRIRATIPHLRAYHMWHNQKFSLSAVASHLRDPPLSPNTVINYVLQAITLEKLEYDKVALRNVMLTMPSALKARWKWLAERVGAL